MNKGNKNRLCAKDDAPSVSEKHAIYNHQLSMKIACLISKLTIIASSGK